MANGLLIRDFFKQSRELRYSNSGSIEFSEIEHNAYRLSLTLEITHIDSPRYANLKTLPENTHYGYATFFKGSTVTDCQPIKFAKFRVFDIINNGIWQYHQLTENLVLNDNGLALALKYYLTNTLPEVAQDFIPKGLVRRILNDTVTAERGFRIATEMLELATDLGESIDDNDNSYRAYGVASPFPDVIKFKSDIPCSFLFRLESWFLVNPAAYIVDNPTDTGDETEGEDEYPTPDSGDGDGNGDNFPTPSPIPSGRDPRDFDTANTPPPPPPFKGGQCQGKLYGVDVRLTASISPPTSLTRYNNLPGPIRGIRSALSGEGPNLIKLFWLRYGEPLQEISLGAMFVALNGQANNPNFSIENVVTMDGSADNCGDPPPIL